MNTLSNFPSATEAIFFSERLSAQSPTHKQIRSISYKLNRCVDALMDEITYLEVAQDFSAYYYNCWKAHKNISDYLTEALLDEAENRAMLCGEDDPDYEYDFPEEEYPEDYDGQAIIDFDWSTPNWVYEEDDELPF